MFINYENKSDIFFMLPVLLSWPWCLDPFFSCSFTFNWFIWKNMYKRKNWLASRKFSILLIGCEESDIFSLRQALVSWFAEETYEGVRVRVQGAPGCLVHGGWMGGQCTILCTRLLLLCPVTLSLWTLLLPCTFGTAIQFSIKSVQCPPCSET